MSTNIAEVLLDNVNGSTFIGIDTATDARLKGGKKNLFKGRVRKINEGSNVMVFQNKMSNGYDNMVRRRLTNERKNSDHFVLSPRTWGKRIEGTCFVEHKGQYYLEVIFLTNGKSHYEVDGVKSPIKGEWQLAGSSENPDQGGLVDKVIIRTFKVKNITKLTINHNTYTDLTFDPSVL